MSPEPSLGEHQRRYSEAIHAAGEQSPDAFQSWFNVSSDVEEATIRGAWDFAIHVLTPSVCRLMRAPEKKVALEIGCGGGRLLNAACGFFHHAIGVDIHGDLDRVEQFLRARGRSNFSLIRTDGRGLGVEPESVDFIYSFIVLQHLPTMEVFDNYLRESHRALRPGGVAQLYYGVFDKLSLRQRLRHFRAGYCEIPDAPVNHTSLVIRAAEARRRARAVGFQVVGEGRSYKGAPDGYPSLRGGQRWFSLLKLGR